ncbi:MAG: ABC transporter permease [Candidatus Binataceae bacterium]|nr:ABC transporter permease [Candidatus Binataceae bacterium]
MTGSPAATDASSPVSALAAGSLQARLRRHARLRRSAHVLGAQLLLVVIVLGAWEYGVRTGVINAFLFGSPSGTWHFLVKGTVDGSIFHDMYITSEETALGFLLGNALGATLGLALWYSPFLEKLFTPFILALGSIPIIALAPLVIVWAGTGLASKVLMSTLSVVVVALLAAFDGARSADPLEINLLYSMGARKWQVFRLVVVPSSLTYIFSGLKLAVGFALIGAIIGEFISSSEGLGHAIFIAGNLYNIPKVFASLLATIAIALAFVYVVGRLERLLMPWRKLSS